MNVREESKQEHDNVENTIFAQRLLSGDFTDLDYIRYLNAQFFIFEKMESYSGFNLPDPSLRRKEKILLDLNELESRDLVIQIPNTVIEYKKRLVTIDTEEKRNSHVYLNYLGMMFGGSIVAKNVRTQGRIYQFENRNECIAAIRSLPVDVSEVKLGFEFHTKIMNELEDMRES